MIRYRKRRFAKRLQPACFHIMRTESLHDEPMNPPGVLHPHIRVRINITSKSLPTCNIHLGIVLRVLSIHISNMMLDILIFSSIG